uniref:Uncharacterized protein n=1 Tax=Anguilla anguilla TaxID=7936 RepID=A0A0E9PQB1_ANGAN
MELKIASSPLLVYTYPQANSVGLNPFFLPPPFLHQGSGSQLAFPRRLTSPLWPQPMGS